ncbi:MAG: DUF1501 domain-containing protein [Pirellulaceae bacterium]|nr:DUF1501 domain-containing protein [Pirellulaceae bacterium]
MWLQDLQLRVSKDGIHSRRSYLRCVGATAAGFSTMGWMDSVRSEAAELRSRGMSCILLFLQGGFSQFESFDPKPGRETGGPTKSIPTVLPGVHIAENWPKLAERLDEMAIIRSMTSKENNHAPGVYLMHTGYGFNASVKYPTLGSIVACTIGDGELELPSFVSIGQGSKQSPGYLGAKFAPLSVQEPERFPRHLGLPAGIRGEDLERRLALLEKIDESYAQRGAAKIVADHRALYEASSKLVQSPGLKVFDLEEETGSMRDLYGRTPFGQGCLLARRLIETGVTFIEVNSGGFSASTNWDTHRDNFKSQKKLAGPIDQGISGLLTDLKQRGMLDKTLVIMMSEFGRTPTINAATGRDHYGRAFSVALAGGGVRGGQVIGATDEDGIDVISRPVTVPDLFCSFYHALKINPRTEFHTNGRPIPLVTDGEPVSELFT